MGTRRHGNLQAVKKAGWGSPEEIRDRVEQADEPWLWPCGLGLCFTLRYLQQRYVCKGINHRNKDLSKWSKFTNHSTL